MNKYKAMYIIRPDRTEEQFNAVIEEINKIFTDRQGELLSVDVWGLKDMAYEIQDFRKGFYVVLTVNANAESVGEYDRICNIREDIMRHIIVRD